MIQWMFRSGWVHPGPLPTTRLRKSLLGKSKVVLLSQFHEALTIFICCVIVTEPTNDHGVIYMVIHTNFCIEIPKDEVDVMFLYLVEMILEGVIEVSLY